MFNKLKILVILGIVFFGVYFFTYQNIINERVKLEDEHCIKVNPLIIKRKMLYIDSMKAMINNESKEDYIILNDRYLLVSKEYLETERVWLDKDQAFLDRLDVKLLSNKLAYDGIKTLHDIYKLDFEAIGYTIQMFEDMDNEVENQRLNKLINENTKSLQLAQEKYSKLLESPRNFSLIDRLVKLPASKCPVENHNIPDVQKELQDVLK